MTARVMADELEVSVRTVYRDLEVLSGAGVPVYAESGPGGGCQLLDGYRTPLTGLSGDEASALLALGVPAPLRELGLGELLSDARLKLLAALPADRRDDARSAAARFHLDTPAWFRPADDVPHLPKIAEALRDDRRLRITYRPLRGNRSSRTVDPLGLVHKAGQWYLVGRARRGPTVFRVARIDRATMLEERCERPSDFELTDFWRSWSEEFEGSRPRIGVTVRISPGVFHALPEVLGERVKPALEAASEPDSHGWRTVVLTFESRDAARYRLLGFGPEVDVLEPADVRAAVAEAASATARRYAGADPKHPTESRAFGGDPAPNLTVRSRA